ncbi:MAG: hypothetical protein IKF19_06550 [Bacilli bacterium]|nr:hypothetical protein [Bacilli bacterium]
MIQNIDNNNKIKENKYKILRMSLLLGNGEDREETIKNFEDAAREIDAMNDQVYLKDLESKFYETVKIEEEEKKLAILVDYIGGRIEQRISLLEDFNNVTGYELVNLPPIKYQEKLEEYKNRLFYIREYLDNNNNIDKLNKEINSLEDELNSSFVNKAKAEERNSESEEELLNKFNSIVKRVDAFKEINIENADLKLSDIKESVEDSKKSLDIFNRSFSTLNDAGISGEEREEYKSYVNNAKEIYYNNKELEYLIRLYIIINKKETEYTQILSKRDSINEVTYERLSLRKELNIKNEDILNSLYPSLDRQYDDISKQKDNIEKIEFLNSEINNRKELVSDLETDNQKVEILSLLKEFCIIDTYDDNDITKQETDVETPTQDDYYAEPKEETKEAEEYTDVELPQDDLSGIEENIINKEESENDIDSIDLNFDNNNYEKDKDVEENKDNLPKEEPEVTPTIEKNEEKNNEIPDYSNAEENEVISIKEADKISLDEAISKSNNVMKRVGEMLGVKTEPEEQKVDEKEEAITSEEQKEEPSIVEDKIPEESEIGINNNPDSNNSPVSEENENFEINENIFMNDNFDADPETNNTETSAINAQSPQENPLFNNTFANKTIDDVMAENKNIEENNTNANDDFWFSGEDTPLDLNSLPDIKSAEEPKDNIFFDSTANNTNNPIPNLDFPSLGTEIATNETTTEKEE